MTLLKPVMAYDYGPLLATMQPGTIYTTRELSARSPHSIEETLYRLDTACADGRVSKRFVQKGSYGTYEWELRV